MEQIKHKNGATITDDTLRGWLAYGSALYHRDHFAVESRDTITLGMAKNEAEGFEYLLAANRDYKGLTCRVSDFTDGKSNTLAPSVYVAWYTDVFKTDVMHETGFYPDALLPIDDPYQGGTFDVHAGRSQMLYIKVKTDKDTPHGSYTATLEILDGGVLDTAGVEALAATPSKEVLIAKMMGSLMSSLYSFAYVLQAKIDKENEGGEATEAPAEAPAEA